MRLAIAIASGAAALAFWIAASDAGPCKDDIYQAHIPIGKRLHVAAARGKSAPESTFATMRRQPTPGTLASEEAQAGDLSETDAECRAGYGRGPQIRRRRRSVPACERRSPSVRRIRGVLSAQTPGPARKVRQHSPHCDRDFRPPRLAAAGPLRQKGGAPMRSAALYRPHHRHRPVHGEYGRNGHLDIAAGDRARPPSGPDRPQARADLLYADPGGVHSRLRLGRRPVWRAHRLLLGDRRFHPGLDPLRRLDLARDADRRPGLSGPGRGDDGAGRAACAVAHRRKERSRQRAGLSHRAGAASARSRGRRSAASSPPISTGAGFSGSTCRSAFSASCCR